MVEGRIARLVRVAPLLTLGAVIGLAIALSWRTASLRKWDG